MNIIRSTNIPETQAYIDALSKLDQARQISALVREILITQYWAPDHTAGAPEIAHAIGEHLATINLNYGKLGHSLADEMNFQPSHRRMQTYRWWAVLSEGWTDSAGNFVWRMLPQVAQALESLNWIHEKFERPPEEIVASDFLHEGTVHKVTVNAYERNQIARQKCLEHYGTICVLCGFDFEKIFGLPGKGLIHVHHLKPLADIGEDYKVDPIEDLRPVCPNCHAMIHRKNPPYSLSEVHEMLKEQNHDFTPKQMDVIYQLIEALNQNEHDETDYLLKSEKMKARLLAARESNESIPFEVVCEELGL